MTKEDKSDIELDEVLGEKPAKKKLFSQESDRSSADIVSENKDIDSMKAELDKAMEEAKSHWDRVLRMQAELENVKRRADKEVQNARKFGIEKFVKDLIDVIDGLENTLNEAATGQESMEAVFEGIHLTHRVFIEVLEKYGVHQINPVEEPFDPTYHEAMTTKQTDELPENTVLEVFQRGYILHGRILRPARVVVSIK